MVSLWLISYYTRIQPNVWGILKIRPPICGFAALTVISGMLWIDIIDGTVSKVWNGNPVMNRYLSVLLVCWGWLLVLHGFTLVPHCYGVDLERPGIDGRYWSHQLILTAWDKTSNCCCGWASSFHGREGKIKDWEKPGRWWYILIKLSWMNTPKIYD